MESAPQIPNSAEVVIIGGGIAGCSIALALARAGRGVVLLDKGRLAGEQSSRAWGFVRQQDRHPAELPLMVAANRIWRELEGELGADVEWEAGGLLALAQNAEELAHYEERSILEAAHGVDSRMVNPAEIRALLPGIQGQFLGGLHTPSDGHAHPEKATLAIAAAARQAGARLLDHQTVVGIEHAGGRVRGVQTAAGLISAEVAVCAAGAHSSRLLRALGLHLPVRSVRSTVACTTPAAPLTRMAVRGLGVSFRQDRAGRFWLGRVSAGSADYDLTLESFRHLRWFLPNYLKNRDLVRLRVGRPLLRDLWQALPFVSRGDPFAHTVDAEPPVNWKTARGNVTTFQAHFPALEDLGISQAWAGIIDTLPDILPVIGPAPGVEGLFVATGFSGHGFAMGPIVGRLLAQVITGKTPSLDLHPFRFSRFAEGDLGEARPLR